MRSRRHRLKGGMLRSFTRCCRRPKKPEVAAAAASSSPEVAAAISRSPEVAAAISRSPEVAAAISRSPEVAAISSSPEVATASKKKTKKKKKPAAPVAAAAAPGNMLQGTVFNNNNNTEWTEVTAQIPKSRQPAAAEEAPKILQSAPIKSRQPAPIKSRQQAAAAAPPPKSQVPQTVVMDAAISGQLRQIISTIDNKYLKGGKYDRSHLTAAQSEQLTKKLNTLRSIISSAPSGDNATVLTRIRDSSIGIANEIDQIVAEGQKARANAEAKALANAEAKALANAEAKALANAEAKALANAEAKARANAEAAEAKALANAEAAQARFSAKVEQLGSGLAGLSPQLLQLAAGYVLRFEDGLMPTNDPTKSEKVAKTAAYKVQKNKNHVIRVNARIQELSLPPGAGSK